MKQAHIPAKRLAAFFVIAIVLSFPFFSRLASGIHQRAVAREIDGWGNEYSTITGDADAIRSAEMLGYIGTYYLPSNGYRSFTAIEMSLRQSRQRAVARIADALHGKTGLDLGNDSRAWADWAKSKRNEIGYVR